MGSNLIKHGLIYSIAQFTAAIAGLISFPVLTKNLTIPEYGSVALFTTALGLLTSFNKFGLQHSMVRFYKELEPSTYISNFYALIFTTLAGSSVLIIGLGLLLHSISDINLFQPYSLMVLFFSANLQSIQSYCINLLVAKEQSKGVALIESGYRLLSLSTVVIAILLIEANYQSFVWSILIADVLLVAIAVFLLKRKGHLSGFNLQSIDSNIIKSIIIFGLPMMGYELSKMTHAFVDRILIEYFLDSHALGLYTAPYNMAMIIGGLLLTGLSTAIVPYYLNIWHTKGKLATEQALSEVNRYFLLLIPPIIAGLYAIATPLLSLLTTDRYAEVAYLLPIIAIGVVLSNCSVVYAAGMQINKNSKKIFQFVLESTALNITLNIIFIPKFGILAAAINTIVSYSWMAIRFYFESQKVIKIQFDYLVLIRSILYSGLMIYSLNLIDIELHILALAVKAVAGAVIFGICVMIFEIDIRKSSLKFIRKAV